MGGNKPCPEKSVCYENYCIPPSDHDDHAFVRQFKKRIDEALKQEKIKMEERRRAQINQIWSRAGDTVATRRGFNSIDSGIYRSPDFQWSMEPIILIQSVDNFKYQFN